MPTKTPKPQTKAKAGGKGASRAGRPKAPAKHPTSKGNDTISGLTLDDVLDRIAGGESVTNIASSIGAHKTSLIRWLSTPERVDAYQIALQESADSLIDKAEMAILAADDNVSVARARELANHYRHVAKARNPRRWGDKQQIEMSGELGIRELSDDQINAKLDRLMSINNVGTSD